VKVEGEAVDILLVEDDPGDVWFTRDTLDYYKVRNTLHVVSDGEDALRFLRRQAPYDHAPRPGLILLDLNLPRLSGRDVIAVIRADEQLRDIPIVVLTSSRSEIDLLATTALGGDTYITKPVDLTQLMTLVRGVDDIYLSVVRAETAV
jgi:CheY-like chemotaxis protein